MSDPLVPQYSGDSGPAAVSEASFVDGLEALASFSKSIAVVRMAADGTVTRANERFLALFSAPVIGRPLAELVVEGQRHAVRRMLTAAAGEPRAEGAPGLLLHFADVDKPPVTLRVVAWRRGEELLLLGESPTDDLETAQATLVKLNNRIAELARENAKKSAQLEKALADLRSAQALLVHREKMAALGQMTAGIAHELNNPLAYVTNNLYLLRRGYDDLLDLVNAFGDSLNVLESARPELFHALLDKVAAVDLPHLAESLPALLSAVEEGVERSAELVRQLRTFSRLDEAEVKEVDLNESLRSVVELTRFLMKENDTDFSATYGELPPITCAAGQVNQAFTNILLNAIQAAGREGRVELFTEASDDEAVIVRISDNGPGVPEDLRQRIFEPFFTTKDVGEGTGLGLSIARTVVESHGGRIDLTDTPGGGATFVVTLPVRPADEPEAAGTEGAGEAAAGEDGAGGAAAGEEGAKR